jgi:hypothetical protein
VKKELWSAAALGCVFFVAVRSRAMSAIPAIRCLSGLFSGLNADG